MNLIINKIASLINVKSIVTLTMVGCFCKMVDTGKIDGPTFMVVFTTIIGFYFGTQKQKIDNKEKNDRLEE